MSDPTLEPSTLAALQAHQRGWQPIPIKARDKVPALSAWTHQKWGETEEDIARLTTDFQQWNSEGATGIGLLLGTPSRGLLDVDLDHPMVQRFRRLLLPPTAMKTGRVGRAMSHYWYQVNDPVLPSTRRFKMPDGAVSVELRSTGSQTVIPPSIHPSGQPYRWEGEPWGDGPGPAVVDGRQLATQVALLAMCAVLLQNWPASGGRHEAYLALAGGLLRFGRGVHPYWERNLPTVIGALAEVSHDADGAQTRISEVMGTTLARLRAGERVVGFGRLGEIIGPDHADQTRRIARREVEVLAGFRTEVVEVSAEELSEQLEEEQRELADRISILPPEQRNPLEERVGSWQHVDLDPYLAGEVHPPDARVLRRGDGRGLMYEGRVNMLFGPSESAKSWVALIACIQEMQLGSRAMYLDFEDEPVYTLLRLKALGVGEDDILHQFTYIHPEEKLKELARDRWGNESTDLTAIKNQALFDAELKRVDPQILIADGMTSLYGLHGLDSNDAVATDVIAGWLKRLTRKGKTTVVVIDHTGKGATKRSTPIGAHHKVAMVQGTALYVHVVSQPMPQARGEVELVVHKDRPGAVRVISDQSVPFAPTAATLVLDSRAEGVTKWSIKAPTPLPPGVIDVPAMTPEQQERENERLVRDGISAHRREVIRKVLQNAGRPLNRRELDEAIAAEDYRANSRELNAFRFLNLVTKHGGTRDATYEWTAGPQD